MMGSNGLAAGVWLKHYGGPAIVYDLHHQETLNTPIFSTLLLAPHLLLYNSTI
jgi:hypothetical protein